MQTAGDVFTISCMQDHAMPGYLISIQMHITRRIHSITVHCVVCINIFFHSIKKYKFKNAYYFNADL